MHIRDIQKANMNLLRHIPAGIRIQRLLATLFAELTFPQAYAPGHFYSPIPNRSDLRRDRAILFEGRAISIPEVDLRDADQLICLKEISRASENVRLSQERGGSSRYYLGNNYFFGGDARILTGILRLFQPRQYFEIGSGFSSALVLDLMQTNQCRNDLECTFVDPDDSRLRTLVTQGDMGSVRVIKRRVQDIPDAEFARLGQNDVLFVDGSHVAKIGSDVNDILFRVLPILQPGVMIHFHDIPWPFEYTEQDVLRGRSWNEAYILRAFLANNSRYEIVLFGSYLQSVHAPEWAAAFPDATNVLASSLWIRKCGDN